MWYAGNANRYIAAVATVAVAFVSATVLSATEAILSLALGAAMLAIAAVDAEEMRIPNSLSLPAIPLGLVASGSLLDEHVPGVAAEGHLVGMVVGFGALRLLATWYRWWRGHEGLGLGDVKLGAAAGAWVGIELLATVLLVAALSALAAAATWTVLGRIEASRYAAVPFGSFLAPSIWLVWFLSRAGVIN